jgi:C4-type Zn-finger protein
MKGNNMDEQNRAKCPICGAEIDTLNYYLKGENSYVFYIDNSCGVHYDSPDFIVNEMEEEEYECPECNAVIAHTEEEAINILNKRNKENEMKDERE